MRSILLCCIVIALCACAGTTADLPVYTGGSPLPARDPAYATTVQVKYLGAGGVLIRRGSDVLATAPFFSNPSIPRVAFGEIRALPEQVDRFLDRNDPDLADVAAILVGHAHYDHLMDVPYIKKTYMTRAKIYGSDTMKNILAADPALARDVESVERDMGTVDRPGKWWYATPRLRFMALQSEHAPIILRIKFFEGTYQQPLSELPTRAYRWRAGQTLAYLIDFLSDDGKTVEFRIHYQDAASTPPLGFPPRFERAEDQRRVDLAILCMPTFNQVERYPEAIVERLQPRHAIGIHWEDFFTPLPDTRAQLRTVPALDAEAFITRVTDALPRDVGFTMPAPGAWLLLDPQRPAP